MEQGADKRALFLHVLRRFLTLFMFGLIFNGLLRLEFGDMRWLGVLQRIALGYFFASCIVLIFSVRGQAITLAVILLGYWAMMELIPVPGHGAGVLTPEGNLAGFVDRSFLPGSFCCYTHGDNEGILSTLPAIGSTLLGVLAGHWLRSSREDLKKGIGLFFAGLVSLAVALAWNPFFPINKLMWTSSYVLFAGGWSLILLGVFYLIIDVWGWRMWAFPFVVIGMNAITIYLGQRLIDFRYTSEFLLGGLASMMGSFEVVFIAFGMLVLKWLFLYFLYRKRIFLKA
jgi:predicted acyltransferase